MNGDDRTRSRARRGQIWVYMLAGAVGLPVLYAFFFRRGLLDVGLLSSPIRGLMIALIGATLGWVVYRIVSQPN